MTRSASEVMLCEPIEHWLEERGLIVHHEVPVTLDGQAYPIDMVAVGEGVEVVEAKKTLTPALVEQACRWAGFASAVWAACWEPSLKTPMHQTSREVLARSGVGLIYVKDCGTIWIALEAQRLAVDLTLMQSALALCQQQAGPRAGTGAGVRAKADGFDDARQVLREQPGMTARELALNLNWPPAKQRQFLNLTRRGELRAIERSKDAPARYRLAPQVEFTRPLAPLPARDDPQ